MLQCGDFRFFDGGDPTRDVKEALVSPHRVMGRMDVPQENHRGRNAGNNPMLLRRLPLAPDAKSLAPSVPATGHPRTSRVASK